MGAAGPLASCGAAQPPARVEMFKLYARSFLLISTDTVVIMIALYEKPSQLQRLATGRAAVTNGYSHRMFC